ncbi:unnamed protein product, partial [Pleuronectes platessa]
KEPPPLHPSFPPSLPPSIPRPSIHPSTDPPTEQASWVAAERSPPHTAEFQVRLRLLTWLHRQPGVTYCNSRGQVLETEAPPLEPSQNQDQTPEPQLLRSAAHRTR